jgi:hypothetical protein
VSVKELGLVDNAALFSLPAVVRVPVHVPLAAHEVALVEDQVSAVVAPGATDVGEADKVTTGGAATVTLTVRLAWPPGPVHMSVKELGLVDNAALFSLPAVVRVPDHAPLAAHEVALVEDQVSAVVPPEATDVGEADKVTTGGLATVTLTVRLAWPPGPVHVSVKELGLVDNAALFSLPVVARVPDHAPLAAHEVALVEDQVSAVVPPGATGVGEADNVTTGTLGVGLVTVTLTVRLAWPPGPVHVSVKELGLVDNAALFSLPAVVRVPDHAPLAVQAVASVEDQVSAVVPPAATDVGEADNVTTGAGLVAPSEVAVICVSAKCALLPPGRVKKPMPGWPVVNAESVTRAINVPLM